MPGRTFPPPARHDVTRSKDAALAGTGLVVVTAEKVAELQKQLVETLKDQIDKVRAAV